MIDLSQYEIGQRFRTWGGCIFVLEGYDESGNFALASVNTGVAYSFKKNGHCIGLTQLDIVAAIFRRPANTRRIPSIQLDPILEKAV